MSGKGIEQRGGSRCPKRTPETSSEGYGQHVEEKRREFCSIGQYGEENMERLRAAATKAGLYLLVQEVAYQRKQNGYEYNTLTAEEGCKFVFVRHENAEQMMAFWEAYEAKAE